MTSAIPTARTVYRVFVIPVKLSLWFYLIELPGDTILCSAARTLAFEEGECYAVRVHTTQQ